MRSERTLADCWLQLYFFDEQFPCSRSPCCVQSRTKEKEREWIWKRRRANFRPQFGLARRRHFRRYALSRSPAWNARTQLVTFSRDEKKKSRRFFSIFSQLKRQSAASLDGGAREKGTRIVLHAMSMYIAYANYYFASTHGCKISVLSSVDAPAAVR